MRVFIFPVAVILLASASNAETMTERRISSHDIGTIIFEAPEKWKGVESYDDLKAVSVYTLSARRPKFSLQITVGAAGFGSPGEQQTMDEFVVARLASYLEYSMAEYTDSSVEGEITPRRFGKRKHGIYARISDKNPGDDPYVYLTHGARLLGDNIILFWLYSNDEDETVLAQTIDIISSFRAVHEWANAPDSFVCKAEQLVGFGYIEDQWQTLETKNLAKLDQSFVIRRSREGDAFPESSEWVVLHEQQEKAATSCDNEFIEHGIFICKGLRDEEFRMNIKTLRFVYVFLEGYHNTSPDQDAEDEDRPFPHMEIGTCEVR